MKKMFLLVSLLAGGCGATTEQLHARAAFDLNCPQNQVNVVEIDDRTRGVTGCGKKAVYIENCQPRGMSMNCTWALNSDATSTQPAAVSGEQSAK
jgi:hypothetical protein